MTSQQRFAIVIVLSFLLGGFSGIAGYGLRGVIDAKPVGQTAVGQGMTTVKGGLFGMPAEFPASIAAQIDNTPHLYQNPSNMTCAQLAAIVVGQVKIVRDSKWDPDIQVATSKANFYLSISLTTSASAACLARSLRPRRTNDRPLRLLQDLRHVGFDGPVSC